MREKFINSLELFNKLKTCAKNPDELVAKGNMRWVALEPSGISS